LRQEILEDLLDAGADGCLLGDLGGAFLGRSARGVKGLTAAPELSGLLQTLQALVDVLAGGPAELDMVAQEDDALAGDTFLAGADGGVEDYGVVEIKGGLVSVHGSS
jgi:hypothetical protein